MKKFKFEIREIDAWNYGEEEGWIWNTSYHMGDMVTSAKNEKRAFTSWMKNNAGITCKTGCDLYRSIPRSSNVTWIMEKQRMWILLLKAFALS